MDTHSNTHSEYLPQNLKRWRWTGSEIHLPLCPRSKVKCLRKAHLIFAFGAGFSGFYLLLLVVHFIGMGDASRLFTVPYRTGFLVLSFLFILYGASTRRFPHLARLWIPLLTFWFFYFLRIIMDGYLFPTPLGIEPDEYLQRAIGVTFIPMFVFLMQIRPAENRIAFRSFWFVHLSCLFLIVAYYGIHVETGYRAFYRSMAYDSSTVLSATIISYIGAMTVLIAIQRLLAFSDKNPCYKVALTAICFLGVYALVYGGTRSVMLGSILLCFIVYYFSSSQKLRFFHFFVGIFFMLIFSSLLLFVSEKAGGESIARFGVLIEQLRSDPLTAAGSRLERISNASKQFIQNPLIGSGLEEQNTRFHPHNNVVEAFMAAGVFGGVCYIMLCYAAVKRSLIILRYYREYGWMSCLFLLFFFRGFLSSPLINNMSWYLMMCIFAVPVSKRHLRVIPRNLKWIKPKSVI